MTLRSVRHLLYLKSNVISTFPHSWVMRRGNLREAATATLYIWRYSVMSSLSADSRSLVCCGVTVRRQYIKFLEEKRKYPRVMSYEDGASFGMLSSDYQSRLHPTTLSDGSEHGDKLLRHATS